MSFRGKIGKDRTLTETRKTVLTPRKYLEFNFPERKENRVISYDDH